MPFDQAGQISSRSVKSSKGESSNINVLFDRCMEVQSSHSANDYDPRRVIERLHKRLDNGRLKCASSSHLNG